MLTEVSPINDCKLRLAIEASADDDTLLTSNQTRARLGGVSDMCLWRWTRDERVKFPQPDMVINKREYWRLGTLRRWQAERSEQKAAA